MRNGKMTEERIRDNEPKTIQTFAIFDMTVMPFAPPAEDEMILVGFGPGNMEVLRLKEATA